MLGGANPSDFVETQSCGGTLGFTLLGRTVCEITVVFAPGPGVVGTRSASVTITPLTGAPLVVQMVGQAKAASPIASLTPSPLSFQPQAVGSASTAQTLQITNLSKRAISLGKVVSTDAPEFSLSADPCSGASIAPESSCTVSVVFTPSAAGGRSGEIQITDDAGHLMQSAPVNGAGVAGGSK